MDGGLVLKINSKVEDRLKVNCENSSKTCTYILTHLVFQLAVVCPASLATVHAKIVQ